ncbi:MAG: endo-1,4-beta-xylanase [bacterium]|nr:endo-1,4-beta-xylanase [bacterium]
MVRSFRWRALFGTLLVIIIGLSASPTRSQDTPSLRELGEPLGLRFGNVLSDAYQYEENRELSAQQFNLGILEFFWFLIEPERGQYDFSWIDEQLEWAESQDMAIIGHALIYGAQVNPGWLVEDATLTRDDLIALMVDHIEMVVSRYAGRVDTWIVTNESRIGNGWYDFFLDRIGPEYVDIAFAAARAANPDAILLYGDVDNETSQGEFTPFTLELANRLKEDGLIDGLSLQFHLNPGLRTYERQDMIDTLRAYGLPVYITELDIDLRDTPGTQETRWAVQADLYRLVLDVAIAVDAQSISLWGLSDRYSWKEYPPEAETSNAQSDPLLFDEDNQPKPAFFAWVELLTERLSAS